MIDSVTESPTAGMRSSDSLLLMSEQSFGFGRPPAKGALRRGAAPGAAAEEAAVPPLVWLQMGKLFEAAAPEDAAGAEGGAEGQGRGGARSGIVIEAVQGASAPPMR